MNKSELIEAIAASADIPKAAAGRALDAMVDSITDALKKGDLRGDLAVGKELPGIQAVLLHREVGAQDQVLAVGREIRGRHEVRAGPAMPVTLTARSAPSRSRAPIAISSATRSLTAP